VGHRNLKQGRTTILFLLWVAGGMLTWYVSLYISTYLLSPVIVPILKFLKNTISSQIVLALFTTFVLHIFEYVLGAIIAGFLCYLTEYKPILLMGFLLGAGSVNFYGQILGLLGYLNHYPTLPGWVLTWFFQGLVSIFIFLPLASWCGCLCCKRFKLKQVVC
jgi:hypothetical protein